MNEQFGRKVNGDVQGNRKLFWKEVRKLKKESKGNVQKILNGDGAFVNDEMEVKKVWRAL